MDGLAAAARFDQVVKLSAGDDRSFIAKVAAMIIAMIAVLAIALCFVTIGTGGQTGVYYVAGQSICRSFRQP